MTNTKKLPNITAHRKILIHALVAMPVCNANRNENNVPKSTVLGTDTRTMWSSGSQKRVNKDAMFFNHYIETDTEDMTSKEKMDLLTTGKVNKAVPMKTSIIVEIFKEVFSSTGYPDEKAVEGAESIATLIGTLSKKGTTKDESDEEEKSKKESMTTLTIQEYLDLIDVISEHSKNKSLPTSKELVTVFMRRVPDQVSALYGRFIAGFRALNKDAAVSVAAAISINPAQPNNTGFFEKQLITSCDRITKSTGHMDNIFYSSPIMYKNSVIDRDLLEQTLGGGADAVVISDSLIREHLKNFLMIQPSGMSKAFSSFAYASYVMVEKGIAHPRSLVEAFLTPENTTERGAMALERMKINIDKAYSGVDIPAWKNAVFHSMGNGFQSSLNSETILCSDIHELLNWTVA